MKTIVRRKHKMKEQLAHKYVRSGDAHLTARRWGHMESYISGYEQALCEILDQLNYSALICESCTDNLRDIIAKLDE